MKRILGLGIATAALAACSESSTNGGTSLSVTEKAALSTAIGNSGALTSAGAGAGFAPIAVFLLPNIGSLSAGTGASAAVRGGINASISGVQSATYEGAIGVQVIYTAQGSSNTFTGVVGWHGLNTSAQTVDEIVTAGALTYSTSAIANGTLTPIGTPSTNPTRDGYGSYFDRLTASGYLGTSGAFDMTTASFSGAATDCAALASATSCNYVTGTMSGDFNFGATKTSGTGPASYNQSLVTFTNLPTVRITIVE